MSCLEAREKRVARLKDHISPTAICKSASLKSLKITNSRKVASDKKELHQTFKPLQNCFDPEFSVRVNSFIDYLYLIDQTLAFYAKHVSQNDLNDLAQEGFLALWEILSEPDFLPAEQKTQFLARKIERKIRDLRDEQLHYRHSVEELTSQNENSVTFRPETSSDISEQSFYIHRILQELDPNVKELICRLYGFYGEPDSLKILASDYNCTYEAVRKKLTKALAKLANNNDLKTFAN